MRRLLSAGFLDAGAASAATFAIGLYAARLLPAADLGAYALLFSAFTVASALPTNLVLLPHELEVLGRERPERLVVIPAAVRAAVPAAMLAAIGVVLVAFLVPADVAGDVVAAVALTAAAASVASAIQDHVRRTLHLADRSWRAATVSMVQLGSILAAVACAELIGVPRQWVPFGALAIANVCSASVGMVMASTVVRRVGAAPFRGGHPEGGSWLLLNGLAPTLGGFVLSAAVAHLASSSALGAAEAARVVAQPVLVVAAALSAVLGPRSMEAGDRRDLADARRWARRYLVAFCLPVGAYLVVMAGPVVPGLVDLVPAAYTVEWLVAMTIAANAVNGLVFPSRSELLGGRQERHLGLTEVAGNIVRAATGLGAGVLGARTLPLGFAALGVVRAVGYRRARTELFESS